LIAYGGSIRLVGVRGQREIAVEKFFLTPKAEAQREHDLRPNEILAEIVLPPASEVKAAHYEIRQKAAFDWPLAVAAVGLRMEGANVQSARVVMGYVAPVPWLCPEAAQVLRGQSVNEERAQKAADAALRNAKPLSRNAYKVQLARVALKRAILKAASGGAA
jgi:xanthine dehydrogenase YagS FAD-binding subunit